MATIESAGIHLGEVTAWRLWRVDGHRLKSVSNDVTWLPGVPMTGDPKPTNAAGIYAFREPAEIYAFNESAEAYRAISNSCVSTVLGTVKLWGRYVEHERGYRAEFAKITSLFQKNDDISVLKTLYLDLRCPPELTPVVDPEGRTVGVTTIQSALRNKAVCVYVGEPMANLITIANARQNKVVRYQTHNWRSRALLLEPGQDPTWLPGWLPLPPFGRLTQ